MDKNEKICFLNVYVIIMQNIVGSRSYRLIWYLCSFNIMRTICWKFNISIQWKHIMQWTLASINTMIRNTIPAYMIQIKVAPGLYVWSFRTDLPTMRDFNKWICSLISCHGSQFMMEDHRWRSTVVALEFCFWNYVIESVWFNLETAGFGYVLLGTALDTASAPAIKLQFFNN